MLSVYRPGSARPDASGAKTSSRAHGQRREVRVVVDGNTSATTGAVVSAVCVTAVSCQTSVPGNRCRIDPDAAARTGTAEVTVRRSSHTVRGDLAIDRQRPANDKMQCATTTASCIAEGMTTAASQVKRLSHRSIHGAARAVDAVTARASVAAAPAALQLNARPGSTSLARTQALLLRMASTADIDARVGIDDQVRSDVQNGGDLECTADHRRPKYSQAVERMLSFDRQIRATYDNDVAAFVIQIVGCDGEVNRTVSAEGRRPINRTRAVSRDHPDLVQRLLHSCLKPQCPTSGGQGNLRQWAKFPTAGFTPHSTKGWV